MDRYVFKLISASLVICLVVICFFGYNVKAIENKNTPPGVTAHYAIAMDGKSKIILFEKNAYALVPIASTTKIITALVAIKYGDFDRKIEISSNAANIHGSTVGFKKGETVTLKELLYGLMLRSGNDAAIAIAEGISGSIEEFVKLMNEYSGQIGLCNTHFESPHGLDSSNHYSTAYDLALATAKARENKIFNEIVQTKDIDTNIYGFSRSYHNINKILWQLPEATGVKTGSTGGAGKCLVTSANLDGNDIIIVVLNCTARWAETQRIFDYVKKTFTFKKVASKGDILGEIKLESSKGKIKLVCPEDLIVPINNTSSCEIKVIKPDYKLYAPIYKGSGIGNISVYEDGKLLVKSSLIVEKTINKTRNWIFFK